MTGPPPAAPPPYPPAPPPYPPYPQPPRYQPYAPPRPGVPLREVVVAATLATLIVLIVGIGAGVVAFRKNAAVERAQQQREQAAAEAFDRALEREPDTATVSPGPGGTKRFESPAPGDDAHGFHLTLPRGWEGRRVGARESATSYSDSVLTRPGDGYAIVIDRVEFGVRTGSAEFARALRASITAGPPPVSLDGPMRETTVGDGEPAFALEGTFVDEGDELRMRTVVFDHAGETFYVGLFAASQSWPKAIPQMERILASWRWG